MRACCPKGRGCNSPEPQTCALELLREAAGEVDAAVVALQRWAALQKSAARVGASPGERRFRRRGYERARDRALLGMALTPAA
jgi:hypothetical protein